ncbi:type II toxin-antitoxin system RelE/ParE family toxin [Crenothrix sp.]|uniref:type II toxin-antitoxin system RelE/ParE family toxin n=1 Tax=Crenothrix sp. TaxID=3100433 RepID=UPI00374D42D3
MNYIVEQTEAFAKWHYSLRDLRAKTAIARRIERAENGNLGDIKSIGNDVSEMRVNVGAGYRVYFTLRGGLFVILLAGGDKSTQQMDIKRAIKLAGEI